MGDREKDEEREVSLDPKPKTDSAQPQLRSRKGTRGRSSSSETVPLDEEPPPVVQAKPER